MEAVRSRIGFRIVKYLIGKTSNRPWDTDSNGESALYYVLEGEGETDRELLKALLDPALLLGRKSYEYGLPRIVRLALDFNLPSKAFSDLLEAGDTAGGTGSFKDHKEGFVALQHLLITWRSITDHRLDILRNHLTEDVFDDLLNLTDEHGWTGQMCMEEQRGNQRDNSQSCTDGIKLPTAWSKVQRHARLEVKEECEWRLFGNNLGEFAPHKPKTVMHFLRVPLS